MNDEHMHMLTDDLSSSGAMASRCWFFLFLVVATCLIVSPPALVQGRDLTSKFDSGLQLSITAGPGVGDFAGDCLNQWAC